MIKKIILLSFILSSSISLNAQQLKQTNDKVAAPQAVEKAKANSGILFPSWKRPGFGILLNLQGGQAQSSGTNFSGISIAKNTIYELSGIAGLRNLPIIPGNPGIYISPEIAYGKGFKLVDDLDTEKYDRWWYGSSVSALNGPLKVTLGLHFGSVKWDDSSIGDSKVVQGSGDIGVRLIPLLNLHNEMIMRVYYSNDFDDPSFREFNNWLYLNTRMKLFNLSIKAGPGVKFVTYYNPTGKTKGHLSFGRIQGSANIFWKLGMDMYGNYVFNDSLSSFPALSVSDQLPLQTSTTVGDDVILPKDTFDYTFFIGARNFIDGLTVGWKYNLRALNALERNGERQISKDHGIHFDYSLNIQN